MTSRHNDEHFRVGTDIGGTFTDIVFAGSEGTILTKKILSTPDDYSRAIAQGIREVLVESKLDALSIKEVVHGTTIVTNTCIELTGARVALITTKGFRDVLEIARGRMPELYNLAWSKPVPLVPRYLRFEVDERIGKHGEILRPLNPNEVAPLVEKFSAEGVESVAICLYNSPRNPIHEKMVEQLLREKAPDLHQSRSTKIRPMLKEYERTSETVVNAYVMPAVTRYLKALRKSLDAINVQAPIYVMQSSGGMISAEEAAEIPVEIVECGPAAGVVGAAYLAERQRITNIVTLDLGGTTTKASVVEEGKYTRSAEYEVGAGIHRASRLHKGKGYVLRIPSIDIAEIGAGGGSIVWMDKGGLMNVGPRSAGASPGPICYDQGGMDPGVKKAERISENQDLFPLGNILFLKNLRSGKERIIRPPVFEVGLAVDERGDIHDQHVHMRMGVLPPKLMVVLIQGNLERFSRHGPILFTDIQEESQVLGLLPGFGVRMDHMLVGDQEHLALFLFHLADHQEPRSSFPPFVFHPYRGMDPGEGDGRAECPWSNEDQGPGEKDKK